MMIVNNHAGGMNMSIDELFENVIAGPERYYAAVADGGTVIVYREIIDDKTVDDSKFEMRRVTAVDPVHGYSGMKPLTPWLLAAADDIDYAPGSNIDDITYLMSIVATADDGHDGEYFADKLREARKMLMS
jgi:hypothetical protein